MIDFITYLLLSAGLVGAPFEAPSTSLRGGTAAFASAEPHIRIDGGLFSGAAPIEKSATADDDDLRQVPFRPRDVDYVQPFNPDPPRKSAAAPSGPNAELNDFRPVLLIGSARAVASCTFFVQYVAEGVRRRC